MAIHQSKGMEFPAVVAGSPENVPKRNSDPLLYSAESRFFHRRLFEPIVDYKTGPKPDVEGHPERVEHYRKQLEIYAYLIEKRCGKMVSRMCLYYTNCQSGDPLITFEWDRAAIDTTVSEISETIQNIENKNFEGSRCLK